MTIKLGCTYRDLITGFQGIATGHVEYISGCNQALLSPKVDDKGARVSAEWFDDQRLTEVQEAAQVRLDNGQTPAATPLPLSAKNSLWVPLAARCPDAGATCGLFLMQPLGDA